MRYFFISDVHANFRAMMEALVVRGFNEDEDTLVSVGDLQDRGTEFWECLNYVMTLPHHICLYGNHELEFYEKLTRHKKWDHFDVFDGAKATFYSMMQNNVSRGSLSHLAWEFNNRGDFAGAKAKYIKYLNECHMAAEFKDFIVVHCWVPNICGAISSINWRAVKTFEPWYKAQCGNCCRNIEKRAFPDKQIMVGHISANSIAYTCLKNGLVDPDNYAAFKQTPYAAFVCPKVIALDGDTAWGGDVRVYVYESNEIPVFYGICK